MQKAYDKDSEGPAKKPKIKAEKHLIYKCSTFSSTRNIQDNQPSSFFTTTSTLCKTTSSCAQKNSSTKARSQQNRWVFCSPNQKAQLARIVRSTLLQTRKKLRDVSRTVCGHRIQGYQETIPDINYCKLYNESGCCQKGRDIIKKICMETNIVVAKPLVKWRHHRTGSKIFHWYSRYNWRILTPTETLLFGKVLTLIATHAMQIGSSSWYQSNLLLLRRWTGKYARIWICEIHTVNQILR